MEGYAVKITLENDYYSGGKEPFKWVTLDKAKVFKNLAGAKGVCKWIKEHARIYHDSNVELEIVKLYVVEENTIKELDNLRTAYDNLNMAYLSQVSLYKSLYEEMKKELEKLKSQ